jgi:formamidopyrimidine-DNA glycosylase
MPELPEVETTRRGIEPLIIGQKVQQLIIRHHHLRWPIAPALAAELTGQTIYAVTRRGKYLLFHTPRGTLIIHLGMSGCLRILPAERSPQKHDHVDLVFTNASCLRFTDPRRFGAVLWTRGDPMQHPLLVRLGVEPLERAFG